ncbi:MAG: Ig-like domain-containing protein [Ferruginibacter sp.]
MKKNILGWMTSVIGCYFLISFQLGCAQISAPTGGAKDSLPPELVKANPAINTVNFQGNKINLTFNEYIEVQELQSNLIISPLQKNMPVITSNLRSVSIKFKDTLMPNTTYSVNFGNSIRDVHESNVLRNFIYVFSTGNMIDSLTIKGKIIVAETGQADSTIIAMLYRNLSDTGVLKTRPDYIAKTDGKGNFTFNNLSGNDFMVYALRDGDGGKTYNSKTELFAFNDSVVSAKNDGAIFLLAYAEQKTNNNKSNNVLKTPADKKFRVTANMPDQTFDILQPLELNFNNPLKTFDPTLVELTDTNYKAVSKVTLNLDSTRKKLTVNVTWQPGSQYYFILPKEAASDSAGNILPRSDTIRIKTKSLTDYGRVILRFTNIHLEDHPVIQFVQTDVVKYSYPITTTEWTNKQFPPGEYLIRILYDINNNGKWDPGNYSQKIQPERAISLEQPLSIKADWDNERDIKL